MPSCPMLGASTAVPTPPRIKMPVPTASAAAMRAWLRGGAGTAPNDGGSAEALAGVVVAIGFDLHLDVLVGTRRT